MEVWRTETCSVVDSPAGTNSLSLSGFFTGKMGSATGGSPLRFDVGGGRD